MSWNIAKFAPQNIQLWNSREMGQVFGLLGVKGSVVGYLGSEVNWFGERFADLRIRGQARNYVLKKETTPISQKVVCDSLEI